MDPFPAPGIRLALAGGGTGGHIVPGLHLLAHLGGGGALEDVLWFQTGRAVEERAMAGVAERLRPARLERFALKLEPEGGGAPSLAELSLLAPPAALRARKALSRHRSQVLVGLGGFTTLPAVLAARSLGLPVLLLEINAAPGRATRWLAPAATRVLHAWPATVPAAGEHDPQTSRHRWTGPPLAPEFLRGAPDAARRAASRAAEGFDPERPLVVVLGGSQGARALNRFVQKHSRVLLERGVQVLHQVGPGRMQEAALAHEDYRAVEYLSDVHRALCAATLVVCRGGASSLAEVGALRRPAWVVPYPHHADRHQEKNARQLGRGARIVPEERLDAELARELARCAGPAGEKEREAMSAALEGSVPIDGALQVWEEILVQRKLRLESAARA